MKYVILHQEKLLSTINVCHKCSDIGTNVLNSQTVTLPKKNNFLIQLLSKYKYCSVKSFNAASFKLRSQQFLLLCYHWLEMTWQAILSATVTDTLNYQHDRLTQHFTDKEETKSIVWNYFTRLIIWTPESVQTGSLNSPTDRANEASSNGFCICPRPNGPRSPPRLAELQSLNSDAISSKLRSPATICLRYSAQHRHHK